MLRMALLDPAARRLRLVSVQILAALVVVFAAVPLLGAPPLASAGTSAALVAVAWAGYWTGITRGLEALARTGAAEASVVGTGPGDTGSGDL